MRVTDLVNAVIVLTAFLKRTGLGVRLRAAAEDFTMARVLGVMLAREAHH